MVNKKKIILITLICAGFIFFVTYFFILHSYYSISYKTSDTSNIILSYVDSEGDEQPAASIFGLTMIPRNANVITARNDSDESRILIANRVLFGVNPLTVSFQAQRELTKVGKDGLGCDSISTGAKIFSYSCYGSSNTLITYGDKNKGQYQNTTVNTSLSEDRLVTHPYDGGLITLTDASDGMYLEYYNIDTQTTSRQILPFADSDSLNLYVEKSGTNLAVVNNTKHEVLYYDSFHPNYKTFTFSKDIIYTTCDLLKSSLYCVATHPDDHTLEEREDQPHVANEDLLVNDAQLITYNTLTKKQENLKLPTLAKTLCVTGEGIYTLDSGDTLSYIPIKSQDIYTLDSNASTLYCNSHAALYTDGNALYKSTSGNTILLFKEEHLAISTVYINNERIVATMFTKPDSDILHTYEVTDKPYQGERVESILPYTDSESLPILEMDYDDKNIYIKPAVSVISDKATGTTLIDEESLAETKKLIEERLQNDNLLQSRKLVYYFD